MDMSFDLSGDEIRRRQLMLQACDDYDPSVAIADEAEAYRRLYSNLDAEQQAIHDELVAAGVLGAIAD